MKHKKAKYMRIKIDLKPISVNASFQGRRFKTKECKAYESSLWYLLPNHKMIKGEVKIRFTFFLTTYKRTDISNLVKITEDILVKKGYIEDDRKVKEMVLRKEPSKKDYFLIEISSPDGY